MPSYRAPVDDVMFLLTDVLGWERYGNLAGFADADAETVEAIIGEAAKLAEEVLQPLNQIGDKQGCTWDAGKVTTPDGFLEAYKQYTDGGWVGVSAREDHGGMGLPATVNSVVGEFMSSANLAFGMYPGLSQGAYAALETHANDEIKALYCPKLATGEWTGTMNL
ncbi:MAG: acyl-CoA dehydrogenase family protein, partial [Pseudomonadota bacterium]